MNPIIFGGGQEYNLRSGTENVAGIMAFKKAVENMTGLNVLCVNVCVSGVSYANEKKAATEETDKETEE